MHSVLRLSKLVKKSWSQLHLHCASRPSRGTEKAEGTEGAGAGKGGGKGSRKTTAAAAGPPKRLSHTSGAKTFGGDDDDRRNRLRNDVYYVSRKGLPTVRFYDRRGIEYASPETSPERNHRRYGLRDNMTASASAAKTTTSDVRGTPINHLYYGSRQQYQQYRK